MLDGGAEVGNNGTHTGTFFCVMTTAQSLPLTPTDVMFAAVMALKAYSGETACKHCVAYDG